MTRERVVGMPLEFLLAAAMAPPGKQNYNISRYVTMEGELDVEALSLAIDTALTEVCVAHYQYEIDSDGAWQVRLEKDCRGSVIDLRGSPDPMSRCLAAIDEDVNAALPILGPEEKTRARVFLLEQHGKRHKAIYYHRFHHAQLDGYSAQELYLRRMADLYNAYSGHTEVRKASFLGYGALLEAEEQYIRSGQCSIDRAFWRSYLGEYLDRTDGRLVWGSEPSGEPLSSSLEVACGTLDLSVRTPIEAITAAILMTLHQASGVTCPMIGVTFMRRSRGTLDRVISPMATVLPLWIDLSRSHDQGTVVGQVGDALRRIKAHQFYGGERAIRDLGYTGRTDGLYLVTANYRVFDRKPIVFDGLRSKSQILAIGPTNGITLVVSMGAGGLQLDLKSSYRVVYGVSVDRLLEMFANNMASTMGAESGGAVCA